MCWTNYHCHSQFCDGKAHIEEFVQQAIEIGMPVLGISAHAPVPFKSVWNMDKDDFPTYLQLLNNLKQKYDGKIQLLRSLEVDYIENELHAGAHQFAHAQLDYLISSVHYVGHLNDGTPWTIDGPPSEWEQGMHEIFDNNAMNVVKAFSRLSVEMIEKGGFDIVGHIDKAFQHGYKYFEVDDPTYVKHTLDILKAAGEKDLVVEINTKSFDRMGFFYPHHHFFKYLKDFNIKVTINSDSHHPLLLTAGMKAAARLLLENGINQTYEFINGKWTACQLTRNGIKLPQL